MPYKDPAVRKLKNAEYSKTHHKKNKVARLASILARRKKLRNEWNTFKSTLKCMKCGFSHIAALDFHHTDPNLKEGSVSRFISNGQFRKAREEVAKCIVLCSNCHRVHHYEELKNPTEVGFFFV